jgi:hypothetical protein
VKNKQLPVELHKYFWDINPRDVDVGEKSEYVIERLLECADLPALRWLKKTFPQNVITKVVTTSRRLSPKSANFYGLIFGLDRDKILCLSKDFRSKHKKIWNF